MSCCCIDVAAAMAPAMADADKSPGPDYMLQQSWCVWLQVHRPINHSDSSSVLTQRAWLPCGRTSAPCRLVAQLMLVALLYSFPLFQSLDWLVRKHAYDLPGNSSTVGIRSELLVTLRHACMYGIVSNQTEAQIKDMPGVQATCHRLINLKPRPSSAVCLGCLDAGRV